MNVEVFSKDIAESVPVGKRAVIYCRVSTEDQSCERQERDLRAFAERAGYTILGVYMEKASGTRADRKERNKIIDLAQAREIDAILVTELTRWSRHTTDLLKTLDDLNSYGVSVVAERGVHFDLSTAQGKMIAGVLAVLSEFERDLLSERVRSGLNTARAKGKQLGRPTRAQRAAKGKKNTDDKHRQAILELRAAGFGYRDIAKKLKISKDTVALVVNA